MIQLLFVGIFVSLVLPLTLEIWRADRRYEETLAGTGYLGASVTIAIFLFLLCGELRIGAAAGTLGISVLAFAVLRDLFAVPVHELGHFLFEPFGTMMWVLGGSLFEVVFPLFLGVRFLSRGCVALGCGALFLTCLCMVDVGQYMQTARVDGVRFFALDQNPEMHDWRRLFKMWGLIEYDVTIGKTVVGIALVLAALTAALLLTSSGARHPFRRLDESAEATGLPLPPAL